MKSKISFLFVLIVLFASCRDRRTEKVRGPGDADKPSLSLQQKVKNERFGFGFSIPEQWKAIDSSANGDGYFIDAGVPGVDLRMYAEIIPEGHSMDIIAPQCDSLSDFKFNDGKTGKICNVSPGKIFIFRDNNENRISLFLEAQESWVEANRDLIIEIAKTLTFS